MGKRESSSESSFNDAQGNRAAFDAPVNLPWSARPVAADTR